MGPRSSGDVRAESQPRIGREGFRDRSCSRKSQMEQPSLRSHGKGGLKLLMCQEVEGQCVGCGFKILEQGIFEDLVVGGRGHEQGQA